MATYNGEKHIQEQLKSIEYQTTSNWILIVSDDGSNDSTINLLRAFQKKIGSEKVYIKQGPKQGFAKNFLSLAVDPSIKADYYCFADQDDVWLPNKIQSAITKANQINNVEVPYLYIGRTIYTNENLDPYGMSKIIRKNLSFENALIQSVAGGNTMLFNNATKNLLEKIGMVDPVSHDWWLYQIVTGSGGEVYYDKEPYVLYRQHNEAIIGANTALKSKLKRVLNVINGNFKIWNEKNSKALTFSRKYLTEKSKNTFDKFNHYKNDSTLKRIFILSRSGVYRQTITGSLLILLACIFKKI